jgi:putative transcriptional regulator
VLFKGGLVSPDTLIAIGVARPDHTPPGWQAVHGRLGVIDLQSQSALDTDDLEGIRLFAGYAGWQSGQLEHEIATGAWFVVGSQPDDAITTTPDGLWRAVLARQGGLLTTVPLDPNLN